MTREDIEKDLADLKKQREQLIANVNATAGVIQYLESKLAAATITTDTKTDPA
jgi:hypothetical protein